MDWWLIVKHNWNSVCLSCYAQAAAAMLPSLQDRAWWLAFCESLLYNFTDGFADDGLCTEGVSYWGYGVSHYYTLAEIIRQGTGNVVDLLDTPKARRIARFPDRAESNPASGRPSATACSTPNPWAGPACGSTTASTASPTNSRNPRPPTSTRLPTSPSR
jgi:hypothetical protein